MRKPIYRLMTVYLDANATEILRDEARQALFEALCLEGNPSSVHGPGRQARRVLEDTRDRLARYWHAGPEQVVFTSGGTEANMLAVHAFTRSETRLDAIAPGNPRRADAGCRLLIGASEHDAIRKAQPGAEVLPVLPDGTLCLEGLEQALKRGGPALVCAMAANNETGILHPIEAIAVLCAEYGAMLHVDAVQVAGRLPFSLNGLTSLAVSGHKAGGVMGAGALILGAEGHITPLIRGGGQERGRRGGTPALPALASMVAAYEAARGQDWSVIARLRDRLDEAALGYGARIAGDRKVSRLPNTTSLILEGVSAQTQLMMLDLAGFAVSTGSACSSGKVSASHVLQAMGLGEAASQAIRVSLPWNITEAQIDSFIKAYGAMVTRLRSKRAGIGTA